MKKELIRYITIPVCIILIAIFIYPTLYKYDKLEQKYPVKINRITGESKVLYGNKWVVSTEDPSVAEIEKLKNEITEQINNDHDRLKSEIIDETAQLAIDSSKQELENIRAEIQEAKEEISEYKKFKKNPDNYFSIGSSREKVKEIMGTPDSISRVDPYERWYYGSASVRFENGKVDEWDNDRAGTLNTK